MNNKDLHQIKQIKFDEIELNKNYDLKFKGNFLGFGWSHNFGNSGVWSEGKNSFTIKNTKIKQ